MKNFTILEVSQKQLNINAGKKKHQEVRGFGLNNSAIKTNSEGHDILSVLSIYRANRRF